MNRRGFMSIFTLGAVGTAASVDAASIPTISDPEVDGPVSNAVKLTFHSPVEEDRRERQFMQLEDGRYVEISGTEVGTIETKEVDMTVGKDGNLWVRTGDSKWKRVVTE